MTLSHNQQERLRACIRRHPDWTDGRVARNVREGDTRFANAQDVAALRNMMSAYAGAPRPAQRTAQAMAKPQQPQGPAGICRNEALLRHDTPARIERALDEFVAGMQPEMIYEEAEVMRACRIGKGTEELDYWVQVTLMPKFVACYGYTEHNARIWNDVAWCSENMTGYEKGTVRHA